MIKLNQYGKILTFSKSFLMFQKFIKKEYDIPIKFCNNCVSKCLKKS